MPSLYSTHPIRWESYQPQNTLAKNGIHLFKISLAIYPHIKDKLNGVLAASDFEKMSRFFRNDDAKRYAIGKYYTRKILGWYLDINPTTIKFLLTTANKPYLPNINFNLSHSGDYVVIAIGENALGVDVEVIKDHFDHDLLAKVCFTINERKQIGNLEDFYTFWTRKEALLKATGEGLIDNLLEIECISHRVKRHKEIYALKSFLIDDKHLLSIAYDENVEDVYFWEITAN